MTISHQMLEAPIEAQDQRYLLVARVDVSEEEPKFSVFYQLRGRERAEFDLEIRFSITNPIGIDDIIIGGATYYGLCIAGKLTRKTAKEAIKCYRDSKRDNPNYGILDHAKAAGKCLASKGGIMQDTATDALVDCLKLPDDDDDD